MKYTWNNSKGKFCQLDDSSPGGRTDKLFIESHDGKIDCLCIQSNYVNKVASSKHLTSNVGDRSMRMQWTYLKGNHFS